MRGNVQKILTVLKGSSRHVLIGVEGKAQPFCRAERRLRAAKGRPHVWRVAPANARERHWRPFDQTQDRRVSTFPYEL